MASDDVGPGPPPVRRQTAFAGVVLVLAAAVTLAWYYLWPIASRHLEDRRVAETSDAQVSTTLRIGGDGYLGYWFLVAPDLRREAARRGVGIAFEDDGGAYADRVAKFAAGGYDAIVLPINSYLQHGEATGRRLEDGTAHALAKRIPIYTIGFCVGRTHALFRHSIAYRAANSPAELRRGLEETLGELEAFDMKAFGGQ